ncbi:uncharacterized protein NPIL_17091 [Nephila pilipes]|uniref:WG repeat-containing protein n=1 Tax=Nephila pilipes TaxID=299642 RepID=A0A8X6TKX5_NEPPI|nr:uncharacterized protein NPIL_17091 [Nephila pilipes]
MAQSRYPTDLAGNQTYFKNQNGDEYYINTTETDELFAFRDGKYFYAKDKNKNELYPTVDNRQEALNHYAKDASGKEKYPKDKDGNELPLIQSYIGQNKWMYAKDEKGNAFYPKNAIGVEVKYGDYIMNADNSIKYPLDINGEPSYEVDVTTNDEMYFLTKDGKISWGVDAGGNQRYAKKENGDEYYPPNGEIAYLKIGLPQYAHRTDGEAIFPIDAEGNEYYLVNDTDGGSNVIHAAGVLLHRYAQTRFKEDIYPIQVTDQVSGSFKEIILHNKYAKTLSKHPKYPLDEYGNEYILEIPPQTAMDEKKYFPMGYPITNDNWVIVPLVDGKEYISDQISPKVQKSNVIGKLYRDGKGWQDFVTNVKSQRLSRANRQRYKTLPLSNSPRNPLNISLNHQPNLPVNNPGNKQAKPIPPNNPLNPPNISFKPKSNWTIIVAILLLLIVILGCVLQYFGKKLF